MKKSKWKKSQIVRSAPLKERALRIKQQEPRIFKPYINHKTMNDITIDLIKEKIKIIRKELDWIEELIAPQQVGRGSFNAKTQENFRPAIPGVDDENKSSIENGTKLA